MPNHYDYIIAGAGAAGLSLLMHLIEQGAVQNKKILLIDKEEKNSNDRTWSFWQKEESLYESIVFKKWHYLKAYGNDFETEENIAPYTYKMIRGIDFYNYCFSKINQQQNIEIIYASIQSITTNVNTATVVANSKEYTAKYVFSSILLQEPKLCKNQHYLLQHFKGQIIETAEPMFTPDVATYMDFRVSQQHGTTFGYVLPFTTTKALVEYTLFTEATLTEDEYNAGLKNYITEFLKIKNYKTIETEQGIIPMTDYKFKKADGNIIYLGTAGGNTRGSTGYTFSYIQKHSKALATALKNNQHPATIKNTISKNAQFYDSVFLEVLANKTVKGKELFGRILKKKKLTKLLSFLDDDNNFTNDVQIMWSQPKLPFIKAASKKIF
jgi:lycopene beta-cyclase